MTDQMNVVMDAIPQSNRVLERCGDRHVVISTHSNDGYRHWSRYALSDLPNEFVGPDDLITEEKILDAKGGLVASLLRSPPLCVDIGCPGGPVCWVDASNRVVKPGYDLYFPADASRA